MQVQITMRKISQHTKITKTEKTDNTKCYNRCGVTVSGGMWNGTFLTALKEKLKHIQKFGFEQKSIQIVQHWMRSG